MAVHGHVSVPANSAQIGCFRWQTLLAPFLCSVCIVGLLGLCRVCISPTPGADTRRPPPPPPGGGRPFVAPFRISRQLADVAESRFRWTSIPIWVSSTLASATMAGCRRRPHCGLMAATTACSRSSATRLCATRWTASPRLPGRRWSTLSRRAGVGGSGGGAADAGPECARPRPSHGAAGSSAACGAWVADWQAAIAIGAQHVMTLPAQEGDLVAELSTRGMVARGRPHAARWSR